MKFLSPEFQTYLASGATSLCWCWRLTRRDGIRMGFTDHDHDLAFDDTIFEAFSGFEASEIKDGVGLSVDNLEVTGALSSRSLVDADLLAGVYDDAKIEIFRVNWQDTSQRLLMRTGSIGEIRRTGNAFAAEVRGLAHYLQQPKGRLFQYDCDANVGDGRCGVLLQAENHSGFGTIISASNARTFTASGLDQFEDGWFTRGLLTFTSGAAVGQAIEVKNHSRLDAGALLDLWVPARLPLAAGQTFRVTAGCDKQFASCSAKFGNAVNFRGFPFMPGNDFVTSSASS